MKDKKRWQTADEIMAELNADPEFQRRRVEKEQRLARRRAEIRSLVVPILADLRRHGIVAESLEDLGKCHAPLSTDIVQVLLSWIPRSQHDRVTESLIRLLALARAPFDGRVLVDSFLRDVSETLRWPIANTIAEARPFGIEEWIIEAVRNPIYGTARQMLVIALARIVPPQKAIPVLLALIGELPGHVAAAIGEIGGQSEQLVLQNYSGVLKDWERIEFSKAIEKISRRLESASAFSNTSLQEDLPNPEH